MSVQEGDGMVTSRAPIAAEGEGTSGAGMAFDTAGVETLFGRLPADAGPGTDTAEAGATVLVFRVAGCACGRVTGAELVYVVVLGCMIGTIGSELAGRG